VLLAVSGPTRTTWRSIGASQIYSLRDDVERRGGEEKGCSEDPKGVLDKESDGSDQRGSGSENEGPSPCSEYRC
jgi:hypothetical protein